MEHTRNVPPKATKVVKVAENKTKQHFPKASPTFLEVLSNTTKITGGGEAFTAKIIKTFLDEISKATYKYGRLTIPETFVIFCSIQSAKQNNIKKAERFGGVTEIVPEHFVVKIKPHVEMRQTLRKKNTKTPFMPKPTAGQNG